MKNFVMLFLFAAGLSAPAQAKPPLIVVMGGWYSCGKAGAAMPPTGSMLFADHASCHVKEGWPRGAGEAHASTIYSCYTGDTDPAKAEFRYGPDGEKPTAIKTHDPIDVIRRFAEYVKQQAGDREILIIGHSHGGWSAMRTALHFPPEKASFVALDPVSRVGCPPNGFHNGISLRARTVNIPPDCGSFPSDLDRDAMTKLFRAGRKVAVNFFAGGKDGDTPRFLPHSGFAQPPHGDSVNHRISEPVVDPTDRRDSATSGLSYDPSRFLAHQALSRDPRTWSLVKERIEKGFGIQLGGCGRYGGPPPPPTPSLARRTVTRVVAAAASIPTPSVHGVTSLFRKK